MTDEDRAGRRRRDDLGPVQIVCSGTWRYDGEVQRPVDVVALPYDFWHAIGVADQGPDGGDDPVPLGVDGVLYYVRFRRPGETTAPTWIDSGAHRTLEAAMAEAEAKVASGIRWQPDPR